MTADLLDVARRIVDSMERADVAAVRADRSERLAGWDPGPWMARRWRPQLDELAGPDRTVDTARHVTDVMVRVVMRGGQGLAYVSVLFDEAGKLAGLAIDQDEQDGRFWIVVGCSAEQEDELRAFYAMLTRGPIGFGEGRARPPRWGDPARAPQMHLDVVVADLEAAERAVLEHGATKVEDFPNWRVYADPVGHPFCLYPGSTGPTDRLGTLARIVIDCADPPALARFWAGLLDMPRRVDESPDRIVIAGADPSQPMIAAQRVADYQPPRWPDPAYPAQMHFDIGFDDRAQKERIALDLGATRLPPQGGSCPVYADPAGHPFCLCYKGE
jgi:glyoxalase superfamily protein